jgi:ADP-ribosylglycohydrolase
MLKKFKGCLLGAAIGDALGMPNESTSPNLKKMKYGYRRPYKNHPNEGLNPGQYTDDTQVMILVATLIADGKYNDERYSVALRELYTQGKLRFPDGSVSAVCEHPISKNIPQKGVKSTTSGCIPVAIPFGLVYPDMNEGCERAVRACNVTHTHPAAHAAVSTFVTLIYHTLHDSPDPVEKALEKAQFEDEVLGGKIKKALAMEKLETMSLFFRPSPFQFFSLKDIQTRLIS